MQVKIRLQRFGRKKLPYYRIVAANSIEKRDGKFIEILGLYHPVAAEGKQVRLDNERILAWLNNGAQPTDTVKELLKTANIWQSFASESEKKRVETLKKKRVRQKNNKQAQKAN